MRRNTEQLDRIAADTADLRARITEIEAILKAVG
jgi:hypothetical protein